MKYPELLLVALVCLSESLKTVCSCSGRVRTLDLVSGASQSKAEKNPHFRSHASPQTVDVAILRLPLGAVVSAKDVLAGVSLSVRPDVRWPWDGTAGFRMFDRVSKLKVRLIHSQYQGQI